jgi:hypothetical protein
VDHVLSMSDTWDIARDAREAKRQQRAALIAAKDGASPDSASTVSSGTLGAGVGSSSFLGETVPLPTIGPAPAPSSASTPADLAGIVVHRS